MRPTGTHRAIEAVWRIESARIIAGLTRMVGDVGLAEDLAQDALVAALEKWPEAGIPDNPGAWLMAAAKRRAIDQLRRGRRLERKQEELGRELEVDQELGGPDLDAALDDALAQLAPSPVVELNHAVALAMAFGPGAGLEVVDALAAEPALQAYHLLPSVRGDFLFKLGRLDEARAEFERAASLTKNARERELLLRRTRRAGRRSGPGTGLQYGSSGHARGCMGSRTRTRHPLSSLDP